MSGVRATYCATAASSTANSKSRPKSKKELRDEKKAAKRAAGATTTTAPKPNKPLLTPEEIKKEQIKEEKLQLKKERRKEQLKEREKDRCLGKKEKFKREREEQIQNFLRCGWEKPQGKKRRRIERASNEEDTATSDKVCNGAGEEDEAKSVFQTLEMGVQFVDVAVGKGPEIVHDNSLLTVRYKLTGGKYGVVIDSSKKFTFRVGKGEVVKGWEIGVRGMAVGGVRKLIIPPKAGYGGEDIGAGPGGLLFFDISVLSCT